MSSRDPVEFPIHPADHQDLSKEAASDLVKVARDALQEKRLRDCLTLTAAILKIDPENKHAHVIQSWVFADVDEEFQIAVQVAEEARRRRSEETWDNAQNAARRVLSIMPDHDGAKAILAEALASIQGPSARPGPARRNVSSVSEQPSTMVAKRKTAWLVAGTLIAGTLILVALTGLGYVGLRTFGQPVLGLIHSVSNARGEGRLSIELQDGLQVFVDGQYRGRAPMEPLTLPAGKHDLSYKLNGIPVDREEIDIPTNGTVTNAAGKLLGRVDLVVVPARGVELSIDGAKVGPTPSFLLLKPGPHQLAFAAEGHDSEIRNVTATARERSLLPVLLHETDAAGTRASSGKAGNSTPESGRDNSPPTRDSSVPATAHDSSPPPTGAPPAAARGGPPSPQRGASPPAKASSAAAPPAKASSATPPPTPTADPRGKLSITSSLPLQIYQRNRLVGSTPTTLELPAGEQTLEYRYENLRAEMTYVVKSDETTPVNVVMETVVQINAQPWAEVLLQNNPPKPLGQTPLSGVRVPVGSLLVFRNPRFSDKTYRVTAKDTTISVAFP